jgi:hypothetical protein
MAPARRHIANITKNENDQIYEKKTKKDDSNSNKNTAAKL